MDIDVSDASHPELAAGLADMYAIEFAASNAYQLAVADLEDYETGRLDQITPSVYDGANEASHPGQLKNMLDEFDYAPLDVAPVDERLSEFQQNMQAIDRTKGNVAGYFYLVEELARESAATLVSLTKDTVYEDWVSTYLHPLVTDEREDRNELEGYLERECGWDEELDITPDSVSDRLGITFDSTAERIQELS